MSDVGTALAVFSAAGVATADFLVALAVNAAKREYRKRTAMTRKRERGGKEESRKSNLQRTSCALRGCTDVHTSRKCCRVKGSISER